MDKPINYERRFARHLEGLARPNTKDRAALASLRRGLARPDGTVAEVWREVVPYLPPHDERGRRVGVEQAFYLVGALFADHQIPWPGSGDGSRLRNLGASLARLEARRAAGAERRFVALLNAHPKDLAQHLRQIVGLLKADQVPIDWAQLLIDVQAWDDDRRVVQRRWAEAFWWRAAFVHEGAAHDEATNDPIQRSDEEEGLAG